MEDDGRQMAGDKQWQTHERISGLERRTFLTDKWWKKRETNEKTAQQAWRSTEKAVEDKQKDGYHK